MGFDKGFLAGGPMPTPTLSVAQPFNDTQLVSMIAAWMMWDQGGDAGRAVDKAIEVVAQAIVAMKAGKLAGRVLALSAFSEAKEDDRREGPTEEERSDNGPTFWPRPGA